MLLHLHNKLHALVNQLRLRQLTRLRPQKRIIVFQNQLVDIDLADTSSNTTLRDFVRETVGAVQHDADAAGDLFADGLESVFDPYSSAKRKNTRRKQEIWDLGYDRLTLGNQVGDLAAHTPHAHSPQQAPKNPPP